MKIKEKIRLNLKGLFTIQDENGIILQKSNLIVNNAKTILGSALVGSPSGDYINYISLGDGTTAPTVSDAILENQLYQIEVGYNAEPKPYFTDQTTAGGAIIQLANVHFSGIIPLTKELTDVTEAGLSSAKEFLFSRITFDPITKTTANAWLVTWKLEMELT